VSVSVSSANAPRSMGSVVVRATKTSAGVDVAATRSCFPPRARDAAAPKAAAAITFAFALASTVDLDGALGSDRGLVADTGRSDTCGGDDTLGVA